MLKYHRGLPHVLSNYLFPGAILVNNGYDILKHFLEKPALNYDFSKAYSLYLLIT